MSFDENLNAKLRGKLKDAYKFKTDKGTYMRKGQCPSCSKWELYVHRDTPRVVRCGRQNNCGYEEHVRDLYPEFFEDWSARVDPEDKNPTAVADAYLLHGRGFDLLGLRGHYTQETYRDRKRDIVSATVRFRLGNGAWWERLIDRPDRFDRKANFSPVEGKDGEILGPSYMGHVWMLPNRTIDDYAAAEQIWFTEGVFDTLALEQGDFKAARDPEHPVHKVQVIETNQEAFDFVEPVVDNSEREPAPVENLLSASLLTCNNYPEDFLRELRIAIAAGPTPTRAPLLVFGLDNGVAGVEAIKDMVDRAREEGWKAEPALPKLDDEPGRKVDWNDLHQLGKLGHDARRDFLWHGAIATAKNEADKAFLLWERRRWSGFSFVYGFRTWWASFPSPATIAAQISEGFKEDPKLSVASYEEKELHVARKMMAVELIANCTFRALFFERNEATDTSAYWLRIDRPGKEHPRIKASFPGPAVAGSGEFKKRLVSVVSGAIWTGDQYHLDRIMQRQLPVRDVIGIEFTGYCREHKVYVLGDLAVAKGKVYRPNEDGFFEIGKTGIKLRTTERILDQIVWDPEHLDLSWLDYVWAAWGPKGLVTVAFFVMSLHAEQIRALNKSLGFLEISGPGGSGKTTLIEFLWKTLGRENYEGFDPAKSTQAGIARELAKVGNLPVVFIEGDRTDDVPHSKKFDWEETKTLYNGRATRTRGVKNDGLETYSPPFRGGFVIVQNDQVSASRPVMERIMSIHIDKSDWTEDTRAAAIRIENWPIAEASGFIVHAIKHEAEILELFAKQFTAREAQMLKTPGVTNARLAKCHGQLLAMLDAFPILFPGIKQEWLKQTAKFVENMAVTRHHSISSDHPHVETFWDRFYWLEEKASPGWSLNHSRDDDVIAIRLTEFEQRCADNRLPLPCPISELRKLLKSSKRHAFVEGKPVNSRLSHPVTHQPVGTVHCWVFERKPAKS